MTETLPPQALLLAAAEEKQRRAADPCVSAWVRANAGTGKTHVLVQRILRLLLSGADPRSILCLTFTKNAAAEMEARVLGKLGEWAACTDVELKSRLAALLARAPSAGELVLARCLFATVIDAPGGLAIMTIHSFCERVLRRYSFEANVPPGFSVLTEEEAREALQDACASAFASAAGRPLSAALTCAAAHAREDEFARVLQVMLSQRNALAKLFSLTAAEHPLPIIEARLRRLFNLSPRDTAENLTARAVSVLDRGTLRQVIATLGGGAKSDADSEARFEAALRAEGHQAIYAALKSAFTTKSGEPRKALMTAAVRNRAEALHERLVEARAAFLALDEKISGLKLAAASTALLNLTMAIFERYEAEKRARAALDFDDLIRNTLSLLSRQEARDWVLYELDARIDHILVDEAQDTSPEQWEIIERLTSDFFAGEGARDCVPTLFAVGDEKQSIYGFQGAAPELLAEYGAFYEKKVREAGLTWCEADLDLSFRTLSPILETVDAVSGALPELQKGKSVQHLAYRRDGGGLVELWQPEQSGKENKGSVWEPDEADPPVKPAEALAARIAGQIKRWLDAGDSLPSFGRPIEPGDILILLRKRAPMARLLQAALKRESIPVAGTDRMALTGELAAMDLLVLADALLQSEDDLALAAVLKGPLFGLGEDELFKLAYGREGSLWQALQGHADYGREERKLSAWRTLALSLSPFDFFAHILDAEAGRKAFARRLGPECFDALDEFLALAEAFSARPLAALAEFVSFARKSAAEVKRETDQAAREVRIMTVHGAKGLEANIVILADTCSNKSAAPPPVFFLDDKTGAPEIPVWAVKGTSCLPPVADARDAIKASEQRELSRLLYVAMTRARDRLYVAGFHNGSLPQACWYGTIRDALPPPLCETQDFGGRSIWRLGPASELRARPGLRAQLERASLPPWLSSPPPQEARHPVLRPSALFRLPLESETPSGQLPERDRKTAQARGTLTHRLLEILPALHSEHWASAARLISSAFIPALAANRREDAIADVLSLLSLDGAWHSRGQALAEAGLGFWVQSADRKPVAIMLGQADRILLSESEVVILDYKSGALLGDAGIRRAHLAQLVCYRLALQRIYPEAKLSAAIVDTSTAIVTEAAEADLDAVLEEILRAH